MTRIDLYDQTLKVKILSITPMMVHRYAEIPKDFKNQSPDDQAEFWTYKDGKVCGWPADNVRQCIISGGKYVKAPGRRGSMMTKSLAAGIRIHPAFIPIDGPKWIVDSRTAVNRRAGRIMVHRPKWNDWSMEFTVKYSKELMDESLLIECIKMAGIRIGMGAFRVDCKGEFGQFSVADPT